MVAGSNPARGAKQIKPLARKSRNHEKRRVCKRVAILLIAPQQPTNFRHAVPVRLVLSPDDGHYVVKKTDRSRTFSAGIKQKQDSAFEFIETFRKTRRMLPAACRR
jgi:hypothetical protein